MKIEQMCCKEISINHEKNINLINLKYKYDIDSLKSDNIKKDNIIHESNKGPTLIDYNLLNDKNELLELELIKINLVNSQLTGHNNTKQKIHYINNLKRDIKTLTEENNKLRSISYLSPKIAS